LAQSIPNPGSDVNLRNRIRLAAALVRGGGLAIIFTLAWFASQLALGTLAGIFWLIVSRPLLRDVLLPAMFPTTVCAGCLRTVPLVARWKCGDHFIDHQERHILSFHCNQGHQLEGFDCPRCRATILVQRGDRQQLRHGAALRLRTISRLPNQGILLGHDPRSREVRVPMERLAWHMAITGGTGRGKSTLLANMAMQLIEQHVGFTLLDPGGDLARQVLNRVPANRQNEVQFLDVSDTANPFPLNILSAETPVEKAMLAEELVEVFRHMYGSSWGPVLEHQLRMGLRAAMSAGGSLQDVYALFTNAAERARIIRRISDRAAKSFWLNEFPAIPAIRQSAVLNKLAPIVFHPILGPIIGAKDCVLNADEIIANERIVIVNLSTGSPADDVTGLLGTFLVQKIIAAAFRQGRMTEPQRVPHVLIVDEFQRFMHRASAFNQIVTEARKYRLSLIVANQYVEQLDAATRAALFGNIGALMAFHVGHRDAKLLADEFTGSTVEDLTELGVGRCLARIGNDWNLVHTLPPPQMVRNLPPLPATGQQPQAVPENHETLKDEPATAENDDFVQ
jgi:predicted Fe-S protein YdhL (DUF1289 family)